MPLLAGGIDARTASKVAALSECRGGHSESSSPRKDQPSLGCCIAHSTSGTGQSLQIDDIQVMSASPPTAVELMRRRER